MSILAIVLGIGQVWNGDDFVSIKIESLKAKESFIWTNLERRSESIRHQTKIRPFHPTHAIEVPNNILYIASGKIEDREVLFVAPEEGWATRVVTCHEAFKGIVESEFAHDRFLQEFYRLQKLAGEF